MVPSLDGVLLTGFNLFKHLVLGDSGWLVGCLLVDAFLTFLGDVIFNLTSCEMAACVFFLRHKDHQNLLMSYFDVIRVI